MKRVDLENYNHAFGGNPKQQLEYGGWKWQFTVNYNSEIPQKLLDLLENYGKMILDLNDEINALKEKSNE